MITTPLIHFAEKSSFVEAFNEIPDSSVCFIKETQEIYTHGLLYACHFGDNLNVDKIETSPSNNGLKITFANGGTTILSLTDILDNQYASIQKVKDLEDLINKKQDIILSSYDASKECWVLNNIIHNE